MARPEVALFATCLVDLFRPTIGYAAAQLIADCGAEVVVPPGQTCCGQPAYNSGDRERAQRLARQNIELLEPFDRVVVPSGSCAGMIRVHYPALFADQPELAERARALSLRVEELSCFLCERGARVTVSLPAPLRATYHDSCSGLRELGIKEQPRRLLAQVGGLELVEMRECESCCGFGGTFCVKYPEISTRMVDEKVARIRESGAELVLAGDLGCLMNIAGRLRRSGSGVEVRHYAEVLAGRLDRPPIAGAG